MTHSKLSQKYFKWVIKYYSDSISKPVHFVWLTDVSVEEGGEQDKVLLNEEGGIITAKSNRKLIETVLQREINLPDAERTRSWLQESLACKRISSTKYDLRGIKRQILTHELGEEDIECMVNFINLYEDFTIQTGQHTLREAQVDKIWLYYYNQIFFPNFFETKQQADSMAESGMDSEKLHEEFSYIIEDFESNFEFRKTN